jgi:hypothetical protein
VRLTGTKGAAARPWNHLLVVLAIAVVTLASSSGCGDKATHESVDEWMRTEKGPGKLKKAVGNSGLDPDLSAHAAQNMIRMDKTETVVEVLGGLSPERRSAVLEKLVARLWKDARIEGAMTRPQPSQVAAKDALFDLRKLAVDDVRKQIDGYLVEWLTGGYYDGRAKVGRYLGTTVIRAVGPVAGERLIAAAKTVIAEPPNAKGARAKIEDELLLALAASGSTEAVKLLLDIYKMDRGDSSLSERALSALFRAYVDSGGLFDIQDPMVLEPVLAELVEITKDEGRPARITNDAVALISAVGMPKCLPPLVEMVAHPHRDARYRWVAADSALRCGGVKGIVPVSEALAPDVEYDHRDLKGSVWGTIVKMSPKDQVALAARALLGSKNPIGRWIGVEVLTSLGDKADAPRIKALAGDKTKLAGYWSDEPDKKVPTLGQRAAEAAASLEAGAASTPK